MRNPDTIYRGERIEDRGRILGVKVTHDGYILALSPSLHLRAISHAGFEWGYGGAGPAQLALALVLDALKGTDAEAEVDRKALDSYQWFKWAVVANWTRPEWTITAGEIRNWVQQCLRESAESRRKVEGGAA